MFISGGNDICIIDCAVWRFPEMLGSAAPPHFDTWYTAMLHALAVGDWARADTYRGQAEGEALNHLEQLDPAIQAPFWFQSGRIHAQRLNFLGAFNSFGASLHYVDHRDSASYIQVLASYAAICMQVGYFLHATTAYNTLITLINATPPLRFILGDQQALRCSVLMQRSQAYMYLGTEYHERANRDIRKAITLMNGWILKKYAVTNTNVPALTVHGSFILAPLSPTIAAQISASQKSWLQLYGTLIEHYVTTVQWFCRLQKKHGHELWLCAQGLRSLANLYSDGIANRDLYRAAAASDQQLVQQSIHLRMLAIDCVLTLWESNPLRYAQRQSGQQMQLAQSAWYAAMKMAQIVDPEQRLHMLQDHLEYSRLALLLWDIRTNAKARGRAATVAALRDVQTMIADAITSMVRHTVRMQMQARFLMLLGYVAWDLGDVPSARQQWQAAQERFKHAEPASQVLREQQFTVLLQHSTEKPLAWQRGD
jgi:hypothetical protein